MVVNDLGTNVEGAGHSSGPADGTVAQIVAAGGAAVANYDSIAEHEGCRRAVACATDTYGSCDIVIANAGALSKTAQMGLSSDDETWSQLVNLYLGQKFWLSREALPGMLERGWGRIIFATSEIARGTQKNPLGAAVMSGGIAMMRDLAATHFGSGVTFNCYAPSAATRTYELYMEQLEAGLLTGKDREQLLALPRRSTLHRCSRGCAVTPDQPLQAKCSAWRVAAFASGPGLRTACGWSRPTLVDRVYGRWMS